MYPVGTYVVYGTNGPCRINEITYLDMPGCDSRRKYYVLQPAVSSGSTIYSPVDNPKVSMRPLIGREEAEQLLGGMDRIVPLAIEAEKYREEVYRTVMRRGDCQSVAGMVRTLAARREERLAQGKKFTSVDERYLAEAFGKLTCELALALGISQEQAQEQVEHVIMKVQI